MPCSEAKLQANRQNARNSTGPRTTEGKARSSKNALKHGFCASGSSFTPLEDRAAYESFTTSILVSLRPATAIEQDLAHRIADLSWRLRRIPDAESALLTRDTLADLTFKCDRDGREEQEEDRHEDENDDDDVLPESPARHLARAMSDPHNPYLTLQRYEQSLDRARSRALKELRQLQKDRRQHAGEADEPPPPPPPPLLRNEPTAPPTPPVLSVAQPPDSELPNEPTAAATDESDDDRDDSSRPLRVVAPSRLPHPAPPQNEPTAPICVHPRPSAVPTPSAELRNEPTASPRSEIANPGSQIEPPRLHILKRSDLRPLHLRPGSPAPSAAAGAPCPPIPSPHAGKA
jgi:hypothetical protein